MRRRMMKWVLVPCLVAAVMTPGVASAASRQGEPVDDPTLTPSAAAKWKLATDKKDAEVAALRMSAEVPPRQGRWR